MTNEPDVNNVTLSGRVPALPEVRELPSGDVLTTFRVVVRRPVDARGTVDSVECSTTSARVARSLSKLAIDDRIELEGSLRRSFWRSPGGVQSRYTIDVTALRRVRL